ncbi:hypothetical protein [Brooklawnia sp.]|uniref:hypothetical protein n=1 Tax=Brooklawnia sp. TaxID=2699740 RepID=UPI0031200EB7
MSAAPVGPRYPVPSEYPGAAATPQVSRPPTEAGMLVSYSPVAMAKRAAGIRKNLDRSTVGGVISLVITGVIYYFARPETTSAFFWLLVGNAVYTVVRIIVKFVKLKRARRATAQVPLGPAFQIDDQGLVASTVPEGERIGWEQVTSIAGVNKMLSPGPRLEFRWDADRSWSVPIIVLDSSPSSIDSALRAFSLGRFGLDLSSVDDIW